MFGTTQKKDTSSLESDLNTLTENMKVIASNVDDINDQVDDFKEQFNSVKSNIDSLERQIKTFISEVRGNTYVSNAKMELKNYEDELSEEYGQYDVIRNKVSEIVNDLEKGYIEKNKLLTQSEQAHLSNSKYYLVHILVAICAWLKNEKKLARKSINKALDLNDNKTSLLFSVIYFKLNRNNTAIKWLKRYLDNQNPSNMNSDVIGVINILSYYVNDNETEDKLYSYINNWVNKSKSEEIENKVVNKWENFFRSRLNIIDENEYPYSKLYVRSFNKVKKNLELYYSFNNVYADFLGLINNFDNDINEDKILNTLLYDYSDKELELRRNILKNKLIIECHGNMDEVELKYKTYDNSINSNDNFYLDLNDVLLSRNDISLNIKRLAVYFVKNNIVRGYERVFNNDSVLDEEFEIRINEWVGITKDGSNEKELQDSLTDYVKKPFAEESQLQRYNSPKTIYCAIFIVIGIILTFIKFYVGLSVVIVGGFMLMFFLLNISRNREDIIKDYNETLNKYLFELNNVLAEIVDIKYICKKNLKYKDEFLEYLGTFDEKDYIDFK